MMILCQNRKGLVKVGTKIYILEFKDSVQILNRINRDDVVVLGEYEKKSDAEDILKKIFQAIRNKRDSFCMPRPDEIVRI